jgi:predicted GNAT family acetyltransferase
MRINRYKDPRKFQSKLENFLLQYEAENNLLLGILAGLIAGEFLEHPPYLIQVIENEETQLAVMRTPPFPVLFSFSPHPLEKNVVDQVLQELWGEFGSELAGFTGEKYLAADLSDRWGQFSGKKPNLKMAMRIYKLTQVQPAARVPGSMRPVDEGDKSLVLDWYARFHQDAMGEEPEQEMVKKGAERYFRADHQQRGLMLWEVEGKPVSMAGYTGPTTNGIRVGVVYTPPEQRNKGYASACTAELSEYLLDLGFKFCFLFTDLLNPTSNRIYQQIGYGPVCDVDRYEFK